MDRDDVDYYRKRQRQEMHAADLASDVCSYRVHLELARRYGLLVTDPLIVDAISVETVRRRVSMSVRKYSTRSTAIDGL